jgi:phosphate/sulfate permease
MRPGPIFPPDFRSQAREANLRPLLPQGAATLFIATAFGVPLSTTHTITRAIVGVGAARKVAAVRWNVVDEGIA